LAQIADKREEEAMHSAFTTVDTLDTSTFLHSVVQPNSSFALEWLMPVTGLQDNGQPIIPPRRAMGARLFLLPKYSPDLNPIEQVFAKFKRLLRKASARTREAICNAIGELLGSYTPDECANYLRNSGYGPT
jgi:DDE superfamily endonuclease